MAFFYPSILPFHCLYDTEAEGYLMVVCLIYVEEEKGLINYAYLFHPNLKRDVRTDHTTDALSFNLLLSRFLSTGKEA